jgi:polar amino acid transport system substrate-binding protein
MAYAGAANAGPILDRIQKNGELAVGMSGDQPPLNATARDGKVIGLEADIAARMASAMGVKLRIARMPFKVLPKARLVATKNYDEAPDLVIRDKATAMVADHHFCLFSAAATRRRG